MGDIQIEATVNGRQVRKRTETHLRLLDFLREELFLTGAKEGCGAGECGTCSVFVDGELIKSCLMPVGKADGRTIETVEGLARNGELTPVQRAFHKTGASQCGYCIPGMVMAATSALRNNPDAEIEEIKERLGGNICRCTGYAKIFEAVELARDVINGKRSEDAFAEEPFNDSYIGANVRRVDAPSKVTGALRYAGDMTMAGMLHMQVLRSPVPHARIINIDTSEAEAMPGVEAVVTYRDIPGKDGFGVFVADQPTLAAEKVRYVGEAIAAVAAEDLLTAREALKKIVVTYEELPAAFDVDSAMAEGAPVIHDYAKNNVIYEIPIRKGDADKGFAEADLIFEETFQTQPIEHAYLEPEAGLAYVDHDGVVTIHSPSQNITHHRHMLSRILNLPINKVRMVMSPVGGGFGGKEDMIYQGVLALAAMKSGKPVRLVYSREESLCTTAKRHPFNVRYKIGLKKNGRITAVQITSVADGGAYGMSSEGVIRKHAILSGGPYDIPNFRLDVRVIYTNNTPSGAFRSFGALQGEFATESALDMVAEKLNMDPIELRRTNIMRDGAITHTQHHLKSVSIGQVIDACAEAAGWEAGPPNVRGPHRDDLKKSGVRKASVPGATLTSLKNKESEGQQSHG